MMFGDAHGPGIAVPVTGACLPGDAPCPGKPLPASLFGRACHAGQRFQREMGSRGFEGRRTRQARSIAKHDRITHRPRGVGGRAPVLSTHAGQARVGTGDLQQGGLPTAQDEAEPVVVGRAVQGPDAHGAEELQRAFDAMLAKGTDGWDVEGSGQRCGRGDGALIPTVVVARCEAVVVNRKVGHEHVGQELTVIELRGEQERFQQATGAAPGDHQVHLTVMQATGNAQIAHIGQDLSGGDVHDHRGGVHHALGLQPLGVAVQQGRSTVLERSVQGAVQGTLMGGSEGGEQMRRAVGQGQGFGGQGLLPGQRPFQGGEAAIGLELIEQPVAFGPQGFPVATRMQQGRGIGQHGQGGGLGPAQSFRTMTEEAPACGLDPHHIATERCIGRMHAEDLGLGEAELKTHGQGHIEHLVQDAPFPAPGKPGHLHRQGASPAHHPAGPHVLPHRPPQGHGVDAGMVVEVPVLEPQETGLEARIERGAARREPPLSVRRHPGAEQVAIAVQQGHGPGLIEHGSASPGPTGQQYDHGSQEGPAHKGSSAPGQLGSDGRRHAGWNTSGPKIRRSSGGTLSSTALTNHDAP